MEPILDILILSNGPGELTTWVRPVVKALRQQITVPVRISLVLSPCTNASGQEIAIARSYPEIDRVQAADHFFPFLLLGQTAASWDWLPQGIVIFLGGDQIFPVLIGKRLGYKILIYGEWETRWHRWVDRFAVMKASLIEQAALQYRHKFTVVGDLMADLRQTQTAALAHSAADRPFLIGLLPGSKPAKLAQGVPLGLAVAEQIRQVYPQTRFVIPVAPTLTLPNLAKFADPGFNPVLNYFGPVAAELIWQNNHPYLVTAAGLQVELWTQSPAHDLLASCDVCLTTVGANTAELGALGVPMLVLLPTQQLDAMRAWDGLPGLLANLPGVGTLFTRLINQWFIHQWFMGQTHLLAWPNIWAGEMIVPELMGELQPQTVAAQVLDWLEHPEKRAAVRAKLQQVRGQSGAAARLTDVVQSLIEEIQSQPTAS